MRLAPPSALTASSITCCSGVAGAQAQEERDEEQLSCVHKPFGPAGGCYDGFDLMFFTICENGSMTPCTGTLRSTFSPRRSRFCRTFSPHECRSQVAS